MASRLLNTNLSGAEKDERSAQLLDTLNRNVNRLNALVSKVVQEEANLKTDPDEKLDRHQIKVWTLVEDLVSDLQPLAETSNASLINSVPQEMTAFADASLLTLVFQNLISNAIGYTQNGEVTIGAREISEAASVECWVSDNGAGIPPERLEKVFEKLETDPDKKEGMGLGLAIVKQIVEAHGGRVTVNSKLGQGSTFHFTLLDKGARDQINNPTLTLPSLPALSSP